MSLNPLLQKNRPLIHPIIPGQPAVVGTALPAAANSPRAVPDLKIPASVDISAALGGIGLGLVNAITGLHVVVDPYVNMSSNDEIRMFFDNVQVHIDTVAIPNIAVNLHIPYGAFMPGTDKTVSIHYTVTRIAGAQDASVPRLYRIKLTRPGGVDPSPDPQHQNLVAPVLPAHIIADGVSEADAQAGFKVTIRPYPYMAEYDVIDLRWNGFALPPRTVHPGEEGASIDIDITAAVIALGGDGRDLMVFYQVYDQVNNVSEDSVGQPWSVITLVFVHANPNALPAPEVPDAPNGVLRLDHLGTNDVYVYVYPYPPVFVRGDRVTVRWDGQTSTGQPEAFQLTLTVGNVPGLLLFTVPNAKAAAIGGGHVDVSYLLQDAGGTAPAKPSQYLRIDVIGQAVGEPWAAPLVRDATGASVTTLNPIKPNTSNEENTATLTVTDARLKVDNVLAGLWTVAGAQTSYVPWVTVSTDGQVEAPVPREFIAAALGKQVVVEYVVFRDSGGEAIGTSLPMTLMVSAIAQGALPNTEITEAIGSGVLNVIDLTANAKVVTARWPFIVQGQRVWMRYIGTRQDDSVYNKEIWVGRSISTDEVENGTSVAVPLDEFRSLKDGSEFSIEFKVNFNVGGNESTAIVFPIRKFTVRSAAPIVSPEPMFLRGVSVRQGNFSNWPPTGRDSIGNTEVRVGQGGVPPYNYVSSNALVASVDANGKVTGNGIGTAIIIVLDQGGVMGSFPVSVENIWRLVLSTTSGSNSRAREQIRAAGGTFICDEVIKSKYVNDINRMWRVSSVPKAWTGGKISDGSGICIYEDLGQVAVETISDGMQWPYMYLVPLVA